MAALRTQQPRRQRLAAAFAFMLALSGLAAQAAEAAAEASAGDTTRSSSTDLGLARPTITSRPAAAAAAAAAAADDAAAADSLSEAAYIELLKRHDQEEETDALWAAETADALQQPTSSSSAAGPQQRSVLVLDVMQAPGLLGGRLPVPLELSAAQPIMSLAASFSREFWSGIEQAHDTAARMLHAHCPHQLLRSLAASWRLPGQQQLELEQDDDDDQQQQELVLEGGGHGGSTLVVDVTSSSGGGMRAIRAGSSGMEIDLTVTAEGSGPGALLMPGLLESQIMPAFMRAGSGGAAASGDRTGAQLAAEFARSVITSALRSGADAADGGGGGGSSSSSSSSSREVMVDMTVDSVGGAQGVQQILAAATAAASLAAAPWDSVELDMQVVESNQALGSRMGRLLYLASMVLAVQLAVYVVVSLLSGSDGEEDGVDAGSNGSGSGSGSQAAAKAAAAADVRRRKDQDQDWCAVAAEEGRGVYEKLLAQQPPLRT